MGQSEISALAQLAYLIDNCTETNNTIHAKNEHKLASAQAHSNLAKCLKKVGDVVTSESEFNLALKIYNSIEIDYKLNSQQRITLWNNKIEIVSELQDLAISRGNKELAKNLTRRVEKLRLEITQATTESQLKTPNVN